MNPAKKVLLIALTPLLPFFMFGLAFDYGVVHTIGSAGGVKNVLSHSGLYDTIIPNVLKQSGQINTAIGDIPASDPLVKDAVSAAIPPAQVQKNVESSIDNIYEWLNGKIAQPNFNINFSGSSQDFANKLADSVGSRLKGLPACTTPYTAASFDPTTATCLPPGTSADSLSKLVRGSLSGDQGFLKDANFSAQDFKGQTPGKTVFQDQLANAPSGFRFLKATPLILAILTLLTAAGLIWLRKDLISGLRHVGTAVLFVGIFMIIFAVVFHKTIHNRVIPSIDSNNSAVSENIKNVVGEVADSVNHNYWAFGVAYSLLGVGMLGSAFWVKQNRSKSLAPAGEAEEKQTSDRS